jgi:hypothetical protein
VEKCQQVHGRWEQRKAIELRKVTEEAEKKAA